jgi:hypothetical protein
MVGSSRKQGEIGDKVRKVEICYFDFNFKAIKTPTILQPQLSCKASTDALYQMPSIRSPSSRLKTQVLR